MVTGVSWCFQGALSLGRIAILEKELKDVIDERDIALSNEVSARFDCEVQAKEAKDVIKIQLILLIWCCVGQLIIISIYLNGFCM